MFRIISLSLLVPLAVACGSSQDAATQTTVTRPEEDARVVQVTAYAPSEEFAELAPAASEPGFFLTDDEAPADALKPENVAPVANGQDFSGATTTTATTTTPTPAANPNQRIDAIGGGFYQPTAQGYQYYKSESNPTSWFGQPGQNGSFTLTQGTLPAGSKNYTFNAQPSLAMNQKSTCGCGTWQTYNAGTKTWQPVAQGGSHTVTYNPNNTTKPWSTQVFGGSTNTYAQYGSWLPAGQATVFANGKPQTNPGLSTLPIQGQTVPAANLLTSFFTSLFTTLSQKK